MRLPASTAFPPPMPANDRDGLVHWPADLLAHASPRHEHRRPVAALLHHLLPLVLLALAFRVAGLRF